MEITTNNSYINLESYTKNIGEKEKTDSLSKQASEETFREDKVVLSSKAREIQEAKKLLNSLPDIREEKVAHLKEQIKNGTYHIEGDKIAVKMLNESLSIEY
ncbi:MAG: flagellar biosynthesis anti-sigma factor FlgM [Deltaproteobacteria bacterium]|nr:flagellar biosynthesis anti-sigma factor FlgM [Deltaproteobacteria bacterium]